MSLHSTAGLEPGPGEGPRARARRARRRPGGGDVSGTGADNSSGLSRWTLIKAWVTGDAKGRIRLDDSDGELDGFGSEGEGETEGLGMALGEADARVLTPTEAEDIDWLERTEHAGLGVGAGEDSFEGMGMSARLSLHNDELDDHERRAEDKAVRRARRHARRRARELGLSLDEFDEGVAVGEIPPPHDEIEAGVYLPAAGGGDPYLAPSHGASSSGSSRSGSRRRHGHPSHTNPISHPDEDAPSLRPHHHKRPSLSASSDHPSEALSASTSSSLRSHRSGRSASTFATTAEEPGTPLVAGDGFTHEDWETASGRGVAGKRRSGSQRRRERELSGVREEGEADAV